MIGERKKNHLEICRDKDVEFVRSAGFDNIDLRHNALPECNLSDVDTSCKLLGKTLEAPIIISAITGGIPEAKKINRDLAEVAEELGIGFGVGSQRAAIDASESEREKIVSTYTVRDVAPNTLVLGNLGLAQFVLGYGKREAKEAIDMIGADALCIHLNASQEVAQPEGNTDWKGGLSALRSLKSLPIVAKECGSGINGDVGALLENAGVKAIDLGGAGGTSWTKVEKYRSSHMAEFLEEWGMPTVECLIENQDRKIPLIATGGVRSGLDVAKAITLGATSCGIALPVLRAWYDGRAKEYLERIISELKAAMFLTGSTKLSDLRV